jgi:hypothetical protein
VYVNVVISVRVLRTRIHRRVKAMLLLHLSDGLYGFPILPTREHLVAETYPLLFPHPPFLYYPLSLATPIFCHCSCMLVNFAADGEDIQKVAESCARAHTPTWYRPRDASYANETIISLLDRLRKA